MSWPIVQLKECARIVGGATPKSEVEEYWNGDIPWTTPKDLSEIDGKFLHDTPRKITTTGLKNCSAEVLPPNSVLFSSRAPIGHVAINSVAMATNQGFKSMIPGPKLDASFLYWWLKCHRAQLEALGNGATFKEVSKAVVERIEIPLPPLEEQKRISAILDQADELRRKRKRALERLNQLGQAIFIEMFGDRITSAATKICIADVSERVTKGESPKWQGHSYVNEGALFVTSENVGWGKLLSKEPKFIPMEFHKGKLRRSKLQTDDILINLVGASIGRACIFKSEFQEANINQAVAVVTLKDGPLLSEYLLTYLLSPWGQEQILGSRVEGARANISLADVRNFEFYMPPAEHLAKFARKMATVSHLGVLTSNALTVADGLFTSLQHRAFSGELTASSLTEAAE